MPEIPIVSGISPPVLFFFVGAVAAGAGSRLRIPAAATRLISLFLLWAIGFKGGVELSQSGLTVELGRAAGLGLLLGAAAPVWVFFVLRRRVGAPDAAAIAACYGSVSVVTYLTACAALDQRGVEYSGHMAAVMALMEAPGILVALVLLGLSARGGGQDGGGTARRAGLRSILHESLLNGPVVLLLGSIAVGMLTGERGYAAMKPLCTDAFPGVLTFFLFDLGLLAARRARSLLGAPPILLAMAVLIPAVHAGAALALSGWAGLSSGDTVLLTMLAASASYIAAPAALRLAAPEANPALYVGLSLCVTFPLNILLGVPAVMHLVGA